MPKVEKAVILAAGLGSRFLPLSKVLPKELWPLVDVPIIQYLLEELKSSGFKKIVFVLPPGRKGALDYFKRDFALEKLLKKRGKTALLLRLEKLYELQRNFSFSIVEQEKPLGDAHAVFQARKHIGESPFALLFCDDIFDAKKPVLSQLVNVFKTSQRPIIALSRVLPEETSSWGIVGVEKIARRFFKIKDIVEKPLPAKAPSDLAIVGRYILDSEIFAYIDKRIKKVKDKEIILAEVLNEMSHEGKTIYGYEFEGKWLRCGKKIDWLKSHLYLSLNHPQFGPELRKYLREII